MAVEGRLGETQTCPMIPGQMAHTKDGREITTICWKFVEKKDYLRLIPF